MAGRTFHLPLQLPGSAPGKCSCEARPGAFFEALRGRRCNTQPVRCKLALHFSGDQPPLGGGRRVGAVPHDGGGRGDLGHVHVHLVRGVGAGRRAAVELRRFSGVFRLPSATCIIYDK